MNFAIKKITNKDNVITVNRVGGLVCDCVFLCWLYRCSDTFFRDIYCKNIKQGEIRAIPWTPLGLFTLTDLKGFMDHRFRTLAIRHFSVFSRGRDIQSRSINIIIFERFLLTLIRSLLVKNKKTAIHLNWMDTKLTFSVYLLGNRMLLGNIIHRDQFTALDNICNRTFNSVRPI